MWGNWLTLSRKESRKMTREFGFGKSKQWLLLLIGFFVLGIAASCGSNTDNTESSSEAEPNISYDSISTNDANEGLTENGKDLSAEVLSAGGGGMLFNPQISPFNPDLFTVLADMGGMYISYDAGESWERKYFRNVVYTTCFDPNRENVIYAGGAGLYRSTDNGVSFQMIFPNESDVLEIHNNGESYDVQIYTESRIYPTYLPVCNVMVNPENSDNIFVAAGYATECNIYESKDNGEKFALLGSFTKEKYNPGGSVYELTELFYASESNTLYLGVEDGIYRLNRETGLFEAAVSSSSGLADVTSFRQDDATWFVYVEKDDPHEKSDTGVYATSDFNEFIDLTDMITSDLPTSFAKIYYPGLITFKYCFNHVEANGLDQIYLTNVAMPISSTYPYSICGVLYHHEETTDWLYGNPYKDAISIENPGYYNDDTTCYGITADWDCPGRFIETSQGGILYSPDGEKIYQLSTNST